MTAEDDSAQRDAPGVATGCDQSEGGSAGTGLQGMSPTLSGANADGTSRGDEEQYDGGDEHEYSGGEAAGGRQEPCDGDYLDDDEEYDYDDEVDSGEQYVVLKFLISTEAAGSIIGKNGVTVGELQVQSGTKIQLSKAREFFPGTSERMMLLCGTISNVLVALHLVLTKLIADNVSMLTNAQPTPGEVNQVAMVVSHRLCGGIIGRGGSTINSFMEDSGAQLLVSPHSETTGYGERVIYVTGTREAQLRAVALIATKMADDPNYRTDEVPLSYSPEGFGVYAATHHTYQHAHHHHGAAAYSEGVAGEGPAAGAAPATAAQQEEDDLEEVLERFMLPEEAVGVIIGKQGRTVQSIRQRSGARVKIEDSNGSGQRLLLVTGTNHAISVAEGLMVSHLRQQGKAAALQRLEAGHDSLIPTQQATGEEEAAEGDLQEAVAEGVGALQVA